MTQLRIRVLQRTFNSEIAEAYGSKMFKSGAEFGPCPHFEDGQTFTVVGLNPPPGFCPRAWVDIHGEVWSVACGGGQDFVNRPGSALSCCTDGIRPVIFRIERVEPKASACSDTEAED